MPRLLLACLALAAAVQPLRAHHSFAADYYEEKSVVVRGTVVAFEYRAPHAWVRVAVVDPDGVVTTVGAEWSNPNRLKRDGIGPQTLAVGDQVVITGSPGRRAEEHRVHLKQIARPTDGWEWRGGRRGRRR